MHTAQSVRVAAYVMFGLRRPCIAVCRKGREIKEKLTENINRKSITLPKKTLQWTLSQELKDEDMLKRRLKRIC